MHVLRVVQVRDDEVKGECQQGRASDCRAGEGDWSQCGPQGECGSHRNTGDGGQGWSGVTIDVEMIPVQDVGTKLGDTVILLAQLPVEPLPAQPKASSVRTVGAGDINSSGCSALFRP